MARKSLHELKLEERKKKNKNIITDMDYFFRDKDSKADAANTIWMSPKPSKEEPKAKAKPVKDKEVV